MLPPQLAIWHTHNAWDIHINTHTCIHAQTHVNTHTHCWRRSSPFNRHMRRLMPQFSVSLGWVSTFVLKWLQCTLLLLMIILFKKETKTKNVFCRWTCYTRTSVYDVETLWLLLFIISKCCWTTLVLGWNVTNEKSRRFWGPFTFNSLLSANGFSSKRENWEHALFNNGPHIQLLRTHSKTKPYRQLINCSSSFTTDWIES